MPARDRLVEDADILVDVCRDGTQPGNDVLVVANAAGRHQVDDVVDEIVEAVQLADA